MSLQSNRTSSRVIVAVLAFLTLASCVSAGVRNTYAAPDAGYLVASLTVPSTTTIVNYELDIRKLEDTSERSRLFWGVHNPFDARKPEFSDATGSGIVEVVSLQPGRYEIYNFNGDDGYYLWKAAKDFSVPFTIEAGKATYIGEFAAISILKKNWLGRKVVRGYKFSIKDFESRDMPIAKRLAPQISDERSEVPKPDAIDAQMFDKSVR